MLIAVYSMPRSGQVWLTRLLADAIGCPTFTWLPQDGGRDIALEGLDRESEHRVTRAHSISHLNWPKADAIVHLVRDPRDVLVSTKHFRYATETWRAAADEVLCGWNNYARQALQWEGFGHADIVFALTYEALLANPVAEVERVVSGCVADWSHARIADAVERQAFARKRSALLADTPDAADRQGRFRHRTNARHMRRGVAGGWRDELPQGTAERVLRDCDDDLLQHFGYLNA